MSLFNYSSSLFSGFTKNTNTSFTGLLGEYSNIKSGTYRKLLKSYYAKFNADGSEKVSKNKAENSTVNKRVYSNTKDSAKDLNTVESRASELMSAATKLAAVKNGSSSLYAKKALVKTNEDKTTTTVNDYDYDTLVKTTQALASAYNSTLDSTAKVSAASVTQKTKWITELSKEFGSDLEKIGITFDKDKRMSVDEATFRKSDMEDIRKVFEGTNSYVGKLARNASGLSSAAKVQSERVASVYTETGAAYKPESLNTGSIFDSLF